MIPIFLIVFGCVGLLQITFGIFKLLISNEASKHSYDYKNFFSIFLIIWIFVGSYYTFNGYSEWCNSGKKSCTDNHLKASIPCCDASIMYAALCTLAIIYSITLALVLIYLKTLILRVIIKAR